MAATPPSGLIILVGTTQDPLIFVWSFAWWPHALLDGTNPFVTHALFAPEGINLAWTTSVPGLALLFAPLTLLFGPVVSYNLAALLLPAFAAWTAYRLCLYLTGSAWASIVGGYLFGFSSFVVAHQLQGHLNLTGVFLLPLIALVVIRFVRSELSARGLAIRLGLLIAFEFSISTEITLTATVALALGLALAFCLVADARRRLRAAVAPLAAGYVLAALFAAPLTYYAIRGFQGGDFSAAQQSGSDLLNLVLPTDVNALAGSLFPSVTAHLKDAEASAFLGWPTLLIVALFGWQRRRSPSARFLVVAVVVSLLSTVGLTVHLDGRELLTLPSSLTRHLPGIDNVHFQRLSVYAALAAAVVVALWTAQAAGRVFSRPYVLPLLAVLALLPALWQLDDRTHPERWSFFTAGLYKSCIPPGETIAVFPFGWAGESMLWQAESGFRFKLAEGYMSPIVYGAPPISSFQRDPTVFALTFVPDGLPTMNSLLAFAGRHEVGRFVSVISHGYPSAQQMRRFGPVERIGGVLVAPACGQPPLTTRNLTTLEQVAAAESNRTVEFCGGTSLVGLPGGLYPTGIIDRARIADYVAGYGLSCSAIPSGYSRHGFAPASLNVPAQTYPYYGP